MRSVASSALRPKRSMSTRVPRSVSERSEPYTCSSVIAPSTAYVMSVSERSPKTSRAVTRESESWVMDSPQPSS